MEVKVSNDVKDFEVYETEKFRFRIGKDWIDKVKEKENFESKVKTKVMKSMRLTSKSATGAEWEDSVNAIVEEII